MNNVGYNSLSLFLPWGITFLEDCSRPVRDRKVDIHSSITVIGSDMPDVGSKYSLAMSHSPYGFVPGPAFVPSRVLS